MAGIEGDALERQPGQPFHGLSQLHQLLSRGDADAAQADIHLGQNAEADLRLPRGFGKLPRREGTVQRHCDTGLAGDFGQPLQLGAPDHGVGHQQVGRSGPEHHLGLADLGHGQADRAAGEL